MSLGFDELNPAVPRRRRFRGLDFPGHGAAPSSRGIGSVIKLLVIALGCALFLALVVWRG
jgi:hypothetical protein